MRRYEFSGYRPAGIPIHRPELGQNTGLRVGLGVSSLLVTALGVGTAYVGIQAGERGRGLKSVVGYAVGVFGALVAISGLGGILGSAVDVPSLLKESPKA
jgi:hypothetical protein